MQFEDFTIERMTGGGKAQIKIDGKRVTITIIPPKQFVRHEGERLSAITFEGVPAGIMPREVHIVLVNSLPTGTVGMCLLLFEIFVRDKRKGTFTSLPVSKALYEALITPEN